jgi:hypothetical protein
MAKEQSSDARLEELRAEHGELAHVVIGDELYAFRTPQLHEFEDYQSRLRTEKNTGVCFRELAQMCCVTDLAKCKELFKRKPGVAVRIADALGELAGTDIEIKVGKG